MRTRIFTKQRGLSYVHVACAKQRTLSKDRLGMTEQELIRELSSYKWA